MMSVGWETRVEEAIRDFVRSVKKRDGFVGIAQLGGLGQLGYVDEFSDVDFVLFVDRRGGKDLDWLPEFEFSVATGEHESVRCNVHQQDFREQWDGPEWDDAKRDAFANGIIVQEKSGKLTRLFARKLRCSAADQRRRLMVQYVKIPPSCLINPEKQLARGKTLLAHHLVSRGLEELVDLLFIVNRKFVPSHKWKLERSFALSYKPRNYRDAICEVMTVHETSESEAGRRIRALQPLAREAMAKAEDLLGMDEGSIYAAACHEFLGRQLLPSPFAARVRGAMVRNAAVSEQLAVRVTGFINLHTVAGYDELMDELQSDGRFTQVERDRISAALAAYAI